jgi:hypothetical protein
VPYGSFVRGGAHRRPTIFVEVVRGWMGMLIVYARVSMKELVAGFGKLVYMFITGNIHMSSYFMKK